MNLIEYLDNRTLPWDASLIAEIEREHLESEHELTCYAPTAPETPGDDPVYAWTSYPQIDEPYQPENVCKREPEEPTTTQPDITSTTGSDATTTEGGTGSQDHNVAMPAIIGLSLLFVIKMW